MSSCTNEEVIKMKVNEVYEIQSTKKDELIKMKVNDVYELQSNKNKGKHPEMLTDATTAYEDYV